MVRIPTIRPRKVVMLRKSAVVFVALALFWIAASGVASASPNEQAEITPFEYLMVVLTEAYNEDALTNELSELLADTFFDEAIPSATGETPEQVRERLKARFYPSHMPEPFDVLIAALTGADESGALTDEIAGLLYDYFITEVIPSATGDTPEDVREGLSDPALIGEKVADFYVMRVLRYRENGLSVADFTKAIELDPEHLPAYVERAFAYRERGDLDLAIADFSRAIELYPIGEWLRHHRGIMYRDRGDYDLAIADFDKAIEVNPNWAPHYLERAAAYLFSGDFERAESDYWKAVELDQENRDRYVERAVEDCTEAIGRDPNKAALYHQRGTYHQEIGRFDDAIADFTRAIELDSDNADFYYDRALMYYKVGENDLTLEDLSRAIELDPNNPDLYAARAWSYYELGRYGRASSDNGKALRLDPDNPERHADRARLLREIGHPEPALSAYGRAIELDPGNNPYFYYERATLYHELDRYPEAIADYTRAIELEPDDAQFYHERGVAYEASGDDDRAMEDYLTAILLDEELIDLHPNLGNLYFQKALTKGIAITGSELPWLTPGLASSHPGLEVDFGYAFILYELLLHTDHTNIPAYVSAAHILIWYGEAGSVTGDSTFAYFEDVYNHPEEYADSASVLAIVGKERRETGHLDRAIADFDKAIEIDPESPLHYRDRGIAHYLNGYYDLAIVDFDTAISILPDNSYLYLFRGLAYHMKDEYQRAVADYDLAIAINSDDPYFHFFRSVSLEALGKLNEYEKYFALLEDEYDLQLALRLLLPPSESQSQSAAD